MLSDIVLVGIDFSSGRDTEILTVGRQRNNKMELVNLFQGEEAVELYKKLTTVKNDDNKIKGAK